VPTVSVISPAKLRAARVAAGLKREQVALAVDRSWRAIAQYETGDVVPPMPVALAMVDLYGITLDDLIEHQPEKAS
jgi:DNA-binding XRE family transcriptional regulator